MAARCTTALPSRIAAGWEAQQRGVRGWAGCSAPAFREKQGERSEGLNAAALQRRGTAVGDRGRPGGAAERGAGCVGRRRMGKTKGQADLFGANMISKVPLIRGKEGF